MNDTHVLESSIGITIEAHLDSETMRLRCRWSPPPPYTREYLPWRACIIQEAVDRIGKSVLVLSPDQSGGFMASVIKHQLEAAS